MWPIVTDRVAWSVCHNCEPCKSGWTDPDAIWVVGLRNRVLDGIQIPLLVGAILRGGRGSLLYCKVRYRDTAMSCAKMAEPVEMPFRLWTRIHLMKHVLHGGHLGTAWWIRLNRPCTAAFCAITLTTCYCFLLMFWSGVKHRRWRKLYNYSSHVSYHIVVFIWEYTYW